MKHLFTLNNQELEFTPEKVSLEQYNQAFCKRTEELRLKSGYNDIEIFAGLMGMTTRQYALHEAATPLPHCLIPFFCYLTNSNISDLFSFSLQER